MAVRVLHVLGSTGLGGAESRIMDLMRSIDREQVQFDFLVHMSATEYAKAVKHKMPPETLKKTEFYDEEIKNLGGRIYCLPRFRIYNFLTYRKAVRQFFKDHKEFQVVQGHMTSTAAIYLPIARKLGGAVTVAHARSAGVDGGIKGFATKLLRRNLWKKADYLFTCSELARLAVFGDHPAIFIPNAIDTSRYQRDVQKRLEIRTELGIPENAVVIGHVGRFHYAKNHEKLIRIFREIKNQEEKAILLLLGEGPLLESTKALVQELGLESAVIFAGNRANPAWYYQAMDGFLFPSRFEGLPGTVVEAQAAGLPCLISETIATEVCCTDAIETEHLSESDKVWAAHLLELLGKGVQINGAQLVAEAGFDVKRQADIMMQFYLHPEHAPEG